MQFSEWEPVYLEILSDMNMDRSSDEASARLLKMLTLNSDMISEETLHTLMGTDVIVVGGNASKEDVLSLKDGLAESRTIISAGAATDILVANDMIPDIAVTDLDGDTDLQKKASACGCVMIIHAHGDNADLLTEHVRDIKGRIMITTQSRPDMALCNFGGFTDGDRAVCTARQFGAKRITLIGFDLDNPVPKMNADPEIKRRKLRWARRIIFDMNPPDVEITMR